VSATPKISREAANAVRYRPGDTTGHYESFFLRANHPSRPLAFWIRYTIFSPKGRPTDAIGELWAVYFDGESGRHAAAKRELPIARCRFPLGPLAVAVGDAALSADAASGHLQSADHTITWNLAYAGDQPPVLMLAPKLYDAKLPKAKALVALPMAIFNGTLEVDGTTVDVDGWLGSQNHNWGTQHTDHYAWGQVAGFDSHRESFLEVATARIRIGPLWTPFFTLLVLRHEGRELACTGILRGLRASGSFEYFDWRFAAEIDGTRVAGTIRAPRESFVGLRYYNPPGGEKHCLNSKIASCRIEIGASGSTKPDTVLVTDHRAAFEILTDDRHHGVPIRA
jgi:hypothetical protein